MKFCFLDFEFNRTKNPNLNLVCMAALLYDKRENTGQLSSWLHFSRENYDLLKEDIENLKAQKYVFVAYSVLAEARSLLALGISVTGMRWIDLHLEHRCLTNHYHPLQFGKQLVEGEIRNTFPPKPKWQKKEGEKGSVEAGQSLASACFKFLGIKIDTDEKDAMRDLIISDPKSFNEEDKKKILEYCASDVENLPALLWAMVDWYKKLLPRKYWGKLIEWMFIRGEFAARSAIMEQFGYPYDAPATKAFAESVPMILRELIMDINSQFLFKPFRYDRPNGKFCWKQKETREYLAQVYPDLMDKWELTDGEELSLSQEAFTEFFDFKHDYPRGNFGAQIVRYLKTKQSLNGFIPKTVKPQRKILTGAKVPKKKNDKTFWDYTGPDGRVRPYMNIYRAQSSRSQPATTGFLFLKSAWMRSLCVPSVGKVCGSIDWSSQEFLLAAIISGDKNMLMAYESGDPYLWFAKEAKAIPKDGTKKTHEVMRDRFKQTVLSEMYMIGIESMALKITNDTGIFCSIEEATRLDDHFRKVFWKFCQWRLDEIARYKIDKYTILPDGYVMWGDNINKRSIANCPIQGAGACAMRKAVVFGQDAGLNIMMTNHDDIKIEEDAFSILNKMDILADSMDRAFKYYFQGQQKAQANCRMEGKIWSPHYPKEDAEITTPGGLVIKRQKIYIDKRSEKEYEKFKKYFVVDDSEKFL